MNIYKPQKPKIMEWQKIKTFKAACKAAGYSEKLPALLEIPKELRPRMLADYMLMIVTKALNGKWKANYKDPDQRKYWPYFWVNKTGSGFSRTSYVSWYPGTVVGSRLCFESSEKALHSAKHFNKIHIIHHLK